MIEQFKNYETDKPQFIKLVNAIIFFLENVYIERRKTGWRLVVSHRGITWTDKGYKTLKGAKIGFSKTYCWKSIQKDIKPRWAISD